MDKPDIAQLIALAAVLGFASGIRLYVVLLIVGLTGYFDWAHLPAGLQILAHPMVLIASGFMVAVEFFADKIPAVDSLWDAVHTFIRIPAGAALAAAVFGGEGIANEAAWATVAAILGGSLAATSHFTKAGTRAAVNTSPEPFSNIAVSTTEDIAVGGLLWLAIVHPFIAAGVAVVLVALAIWLLPKVLRFVAGVFRRVFGTVKPTKDDSRESVPSPRPRLTPCRGRLRPGPNLRPGEN